jgi:hypothetical protein
VSNPKASSYTAAFSSQPAASKVSKASGSTMPGLPYIPIGC